MARLATEREYRRTTRKDLGEWQVRGTWDHRTGERLLVLEQIEDVNEGNGNVGQSAERHIIVFTQEELKDIGDWITRWRRG